MLLSSKDTEEDTMKTIYQSALAYSRTSYVQSAGYTVYVLQDADGNQYITDTSTLHAKQYDRCHVVFNCNQA